MLTAARLQVAEILDCTVPEVLFTRGGAEVAEGHGFLKITPPKQLKHTAINTSSDHPIARWFSPVALSDKPENINAPGSTTKTIPDYFDRLNAISVMTG